jgi:alpha-L-fucosidase
MTTEQVVQSLVDIVSKNGNFLLDIGPRADGTIPEIMQTRLRETGRWLRTNGEAVYDTTYWSKMAELGDDIRTNRGVGTRDGHQASQNHGHRAALRGKWPS